MVSLPRWSFALALGVALARHSVAQDLCLPEPPPQPVAVVAAPAETPSTTQDKTIEVEANGFELNRDAPAEFSNGVTIH